MSEKGRVRASGQVTRSPAADTAPAASDDRIAAAITRLHDAVIEAERAVRGRPRSTEVRESLRDALNAESHALGSLGFRTYDEFVSSAGSHTNGESADARATKLESSLAEAVAFREEGLARQTELERTTAEQSETITTLTAELKATRARMTQMKSEFDAEAQAHDDLTTTAEEHNAKLVLETNRLISSVERLEEQLAERTQAAAALQAEVSELRADRERRAAESVPTEQLAALRDRYRQLESALAEARKNGVSAESRLAEVERTASARGAQLEAARARIEQAEASLAQTAEGARAAADQFQCEMIEARQVIAAHTAELDGARVELIAVTDRNHALGDDLAHMRDELDVSKADIDKLSRDLVECAAERDLVKAQLEARQVSDAEIEASALLVESLRQELQDAHEVLSGVNAKLHERLLRLEEDQAEDPA